MSTIDIWSSILSSSSNKLISTSSYVHPLVKRSTTFLSEKSLEICTESLGSETGSGSDCFSYSPISYKEDSNEQQQQYSSEDFRVIEYNYSKRLISSFPPPLPSFHVQSRRQNGRLILEEVSILPKNSLRAQRFNGHLLLNFINRNDPEIDDKVKVFEQVFDDTPHSDSGVSVMEHSPRFSSEMINVNIFSMTLCYFDLSSRFNSSINLMMEEEEEKDTSNARECYTYPSSISQSSLTREVAEVIPTPPPLPSIAVVAASLNTYEYFWRKKQTVPVNNSIIEDQCNKNYYYYNNKQVVVTTDTKARSTTMIAPYDQQQDLVLTRGNNNLVPLLRNCKEPRRSLIIWEPYCIATS